MKRFNQSLRTLPTKFECVQFFYAKKSRKDNRKILWKSWSYCEEKCFSFLDSFYALNVYNQHIVIRYFSESVLKRVEKKKKVCAWEYEEAALFSFRMMIIQLNFLSNHWSWIYFNYVKWKGFFSPSLYKTSESAPFLFISVIIFIFIIIRHTHRTWI